MVNYKNYGKGIVSQAKFLSTLALIAYNSISYAQEPKLALADTTIYLTDTILNHVNIDNKLFSIHVLRDKFNKKNESFISNTGLELSQSPITLIVSKSGGVDPLFAKKLDLEAKDVPYINYSFTKKHGPDLTKPGKLYLTINRSHGGSGSSDSAFFITHEEGTISMEYLFRSSGELDFVVFNKDDNQFLLLEGIWDKGESHYENHRYRIKKFLFIGGGFEQKVIGVSKFKYPTIINVDSPIEILSSIKAKEAKILRDVNLADYL